MNRHRRTQVSMPSDYRDDVSMYHHLIPVYLERDSSCLRRILESLQQVLHVLDLVFPQQCLVQQMCEAHQLQPHTKSNRHQYIIHASSTHHPKCIRTSVLMTLSTNRYTKNSYKRFKKQIYKPHRDHNHCDDRISINQHTQTLHPHGRNNVRTKSAAVSTF